MESHTHKKRIKLGAKNGMNFFSTHENTAIYTWTLTTIFHSLQKKSLFVSTMFPSFMSKREYTPKQRATIKKVVERFDRRSKTRSSRNLLVFGRGGTPLFATPKKCGLCKISVQDPAEFQNFVHELTGADEPAAPDYQYTCPRNTFIYFAHRILQNQIREKAEVIHRKSFSSSKKPFFRENGKQSKNFWR